MHDASVTFAALTRRPVLIDGADREFDRLIKAVAQERCRDSFARLFEHFAPRLKAYLMRSGAAPAVAEDFAQDAMLVVWRKADLFDPQRARAATWIFTIARNRRIDALRRDGHAPPSPDVSLAPDDPARPDDILESDDEARRVHVAMASLPTEQVELIRLSFFNDQPHAEIAESLGLPLGTVKSRIRAALQKLRAALEPQS
jgi:RNA polymerase sigma-70 factor (ECF subfamily)